MARPWDTTTSLASYDVARSVLNKDIGAILDDPNGPAHAVGLQQLMMFSVYETCNSDPNDGPFGAYLTQSFPNFVPSTSTTPTAGVTVCAQIVIAGDHPANTNVPFSTAAVFEVVFKMGFDLLSYQFLACQPPPAPPTSGTVTDPRGNANILKNQLANALYPVMHNVMIEYAPTRYDVDDLTTFLTNMNAQMQIAVNANVSKMIQASFFTPTLMTMMNYVFRPAFSIMYLMSFDPTMSTRVNTNFFDATYAVSCIYDIFGDLLTQLLTFQAGTAVGSLGSQSSLVPSNITAITAVQTGFNAFRAKMATDNTNLMVARYNDIAALSQSTQKTAQANQDSTRDIALRTGITSAQQTNLAISRDRLHVDRWQMYSWSIAYVLMTGTAAFLIATGATLHFWGLALIVSLILVVLFLIAFFNSPHPSSNASPYV